DQRHVVEDAAEVRAHHDEIDAAAVAAEQPDRTKRTAEQDCEGGEIYRLERIELRAAAQPDVEWHKKRQEAQAAIEQPLVVDQESDEDHRDDDEPRGERERRGADERNALQSVVTLWTGGDP